MLKKLVFTSNLTFEICSSLVSEICKNFKLQDPIFLSKEKDELFGAQININNLNKNDFLLLTTFCSKNKLDVNLLSLIVSQKKIFMADMDSTIITGESMDQLASFSGLSKKISDR